MSGLGLGVDSCSSKARYALHSHPTNNDDDIECINSTRDESPVDLIVLSLRVAIAACRAACSLVVICGQATETKGRACVRVDFDHTEDRSSMRRYRRCDIFQY